MGRLRIAATLLGAVIVLPLAAGCGADADADDDKAAPSGAASSVAVPSTAPGDLKTLASLTGCDPQVRGESEELTEAVCKTSDGDYVVTTFPKEKLKLVWLDAASMYGGKYLVGPRWAIGAAPKVLEKLRPKIGGEIQSLDSTSTG